MFQVFVANGSSQHHWNHLVSHTSGEMVIQGKLFHNFLASKDLGVEKRGWSKNHPFVMVWANISSIDTGMGWYNVITNSEFQKSTNLTKNLLVIKER